MPMYDYTMPKLCRRLVNDQEKSFNRLQRIIIEESHPSNQDYSSYALILFDDNAMSDKCKSATQFFNKFTG